MDLRDLLYFQEIAATGNLGHAARRLGRSKPALTKCLRRLEAAIGAPVVERSGRGIVLTPVGRALQERSGDLLRRAGDLGREMHDLAGGVLGHVRIGASALTAELLLPGLCRDLIARSPRLTFEIVIGMGDVLRTALRNGTLDVVVGSISWDQDEEFAALELCEDEVAIVAGRSHRLVGRRVGLADLVGERWLLANTGVANRRWLERIFLEANLPAPVVQIEASAIQVLPSLIDETGVLTIMSGRSVALSGNGRLRSLLVPEAAMRRTLGILYRQGERLSPAAAALVDIADAGRKGTDRWRSGLQGAAGEPDPRAPTT